jgi:2-amino-4-hydroxy-6-hydroxymethyldihydropteridine diphosphokinase
MTEVYLALGANVGDARANISRAVELLNRHLNGIKQASVYVSKAVGYTDQSDFVNTAISGQTDLTPGKLFKFIKDIEQQVGRVKRFKWGPREIDIDIIFYGDQVVDTAELTVPHPRFRERDFVLQPLLDLNPKLVDPVSGQTISQLLAKLNPSQRSIFH